MRSIAFAITILTVCGCSPSPAQIVQKEEVAPLTVSPSAEGSPPLLGSPSISTKGPSPSVLTLPEAPRSRQTLVADSGHVVEVYPPLVEPSHAEPLVVFLHATCMQPADICDFWSKGGRDENWLVCPAGPSVCYGAPDWSGKPSLKADTLQSAMNAVNGAFSQWVDHDKGNVLIGYSRGAFAARDMLYERPEMFSSFHGLILLSAAVKLDPAKLKAAGIRRVLFATGDNDGSRPTMRSSLALIEASGIPTKFVSLGKVGHWLPDNLEPIMRDAIAWVETPAS